jgi:amino acid adenylation domain-containing protein
MRVDEFLVRAAARWPDKVALVCGRQRRTFRELDQAANRVARALMAHGVRPGDRVAIHLPNSFEAAAGLFGALKAGAVFVMIHPTTKREKLEHIVRDCGAVALLADAPVSESDPPLPAVPFLLLRERAGGTVENTAGRMTFSALAEQVAATVPAVDSAGVDLACLIYTSGSTGAPKGVMCGHDNVVFVTRTVVAYLGNNEHDVVLSVLPLSFSYGLYQLLASVYCGATLVLEPAPAFPGALLKRLEAEQVTGFAGVPTVYAILLGLDWSAFDLSRLRYLTNAAAALPVEHVRQLRRRLPQAALYLMHGLTEVARTVFLPPEQVDARPDSVGKAMPGTEVWLEDEHGRRVGPGEVGEMVVRGPHVMRGYWNDPEATAARFRPAPSSASSATPGLERVCYTGDLFRMDAEGYLYFVARKDDIIKCRGEKVSPREVENVIYGLAGVTEAAVIGVPDPVLGQAVKAFVVAPGRAWTAAEVMAHCKAHLEDIMVPKFVEFRDALPKTPSGKIRKVELR